MRSPSNAMLRSPARAGRGSIMWVTLLVATASPAAKLTVSRRSRYMSVQAPSSVVAPSARAVRPRDLFRDMLLPLHVDDLRARRNANLLSLRNVEDVTDRRVRAVRDALEAALHRLGDLRLAEQVEIRVIRRLRVVERRAQHVARTGRAHQTRRHDDDEVGFLLLEGCAACARAE